jgi:Na+-driven multidrug efflux pump
MATPNLTEGPIGPSLRSFAVPTGFGIAFWMLVSLVDPLYVGGIGVAPLAATNFTFTVDTGVMAIGIGLGLGSTSAIASASSGSGPRCWRHQRGGSRTR